MAYKYYSNNLSNSLNSFNTGVGPLLSSSDWCPQKSLPEGTDYCERKIKFLKANHDKLVEVAGSKQNTVEQVAMVLQAKMRQSSTTTEPQGS
jgi:hypothetical protein